MIREYVAETTSVTTGRLQTIDSPIGRFRYHRLKESAFFGYQHYQNGVQHASIATPEKALLDLLYLTPHSANQSYLTELRLQNIETLDLHRMEEIAHRFGAPRLKRAVTLLRRST